MFRFGARADDHLNFRPDYILPMCTHCVPCPRPPDHLADHTLRQQCSPNTSSSCIQSCPQCSYHKFEIDLIHMHFDREAFEFNMCAHVYLIEKKLKVACTYVRTHTYCKLLLLSKYVLVYYSQNSEFCDGARLMHSLFHSQVQRPVATINRSPSDIKT